MTNEQLLRLAKPVSAIMKETHPLSDLANELLFVNPKKALEISTHLLAITSAADELGQMIKREYAAMQASEGQGALTE